MPHALGRFYKITLYNQAGLVYIVCMMTNTTETQNTMNRVMDGMDNAADTFNSNEEWYRQFNDGPTFDEAYRQLRIAAGIECASCGEQGEHDCTTDTDRYEELRHAKERMEQAAALDDYPDAEADERYRRIVEEMKEVS